jgi:hypothetical protein
VRRFDQRSREIRAHVHDKSRWLLRLEDEDLRRVSPEALHPPRGYTPRLLVEAGEWLSP